MHDKTIIINEAIDDIRKAMELENTGFIAPCECSEMLAIKLEKFHLKMLLLETAGCSEDHIKELLSI